jgi:hypothetical protein
LFLAVVWTLSVGTVIKNFQTGGIKLVTTIELNHPTSKLERHRTSLVEEFTKRPPASAKEAAFRSEQYDRSEMQSRIGIMRRFSQKCR